MTKLKNKTHCTRIYFCYSSKNTFKFRKIADSIELIFNIILNLLIIFDGIEIQYFRLREHLEHLVSRCAKKLRKCGCSPYTAFDKAFSFFWAAPILRIIMPTYLSIDVSVDRGGFFFDLNKNKLQKIQTIKECKVKVSILLQIAVCKNILETYSIAFTTRYKSNQKNQFQELIGTVISLDGDIIQEIAQTSLDFPDLPKLMLSHHWLINKLLRGIQREIAHYFNSVGWLLFISGSTINIIHLLNTNNWLNCQNILWITLPFIFLLLSLFRTQLQNYFLIWIWRQLLK